MRMFRLLFALFGLLAVITLAPTARAAEADFNGRWDIEVHAKAADIQFTTTKAWWLGITGAGTPEMKIQFVGSPDGSLDDITEAKVEDERAALYMDAQSTHPESRRIRRTASNMRRNTSMGSCRAR